MHAPGHLRDGFVALVEGDEDADGLFFYDPAKQERWEHMSAEERLSWLSGQLWNCTDVLPSDVCGELEIPQGSTYAQAARLIRQQ
jgi:hypothetical protein